MEKEDDIPLTYWKGVDEYQDPVYPTNFADFFIEVANLLNYLVEWTVILNESLRTKMRSWKTISTKLSSYIRWI